MQTWPCSIAPLGPFPSAISLPSPLRKITHATFIPYSSTQPSHYICPSSIRFISSASGSNVDCGCRWHSQSHPGFTCCCRTVHLDRQSRNHPAASGTPLQLTSFAPHHPSEWNNSRQFQCRAAAVAEEVELGSESGPHPASNRPTGPTSHCIANSPLVLPP